MFMVKMIWFQDFPEHHPGRGTGDAGDTGVHYVLLSTQASVFPNRTVQNRVQPTPQAQPKATGGWASSLSGSPGWGSLGCSSGCSPIGRVRPAAWAQHPGLTTPVHLRRPCTGPHGWAGMGLGLGPPACHCLLGLPAAKRPRMTSD